MRVLHLAAAAGLSLALLAGCGGDDGPDRATELARVQVEIAVDAVERGGKPVLRVDCEDSERSDPPPGSLDCIAITDESPESDTIPVPIVIGQPYAARIDPDTGKGAWCRVTPVAGEGATPDPERIEALPERCGGTAAGH